MVGEDPRENKKIELVINQINKKIGWKNIKIIVAELVELCGSN